MPGRGERRTAAGAPAKPVRTSALAPGAEKFIPEGPRVTLAQLREAAQGCRGCQLYKRATQSVFGEGPAHANLMFVGEQPGDQEDLTGHVFVGPAGGVLRRAMDEAGIAPGKVYITNAVKHFKWEPSPRGKRRIHARPNPLEMRACFGSSEE